jgi:hypothetical protein
MTDAGGNIPRPVFEYGPIQLAAQRAQPEPCVPGRSILIQREL